VEFEPGIPEPMQQLLFTPETSGGLLIAIPPAQADVVKSLFEEANHPFWIIGEAKEGEDISVNR